MAAVVFALITVAAFQSPRSTPLDTMLTWSLSFAFWGTLAVLSVKYLPVSDGKSSRPKKTDPEKDEIGPSLHTAHNGGYVFTVYFATSLCLCYSIAYMVLCVCLLIDRGMVFEWLQLALGGDHPFKTVIRMMALLVAIQIVTMLVLWRINKRLEASISGEATS